MDNKNLSNRYNQTINGSFDTAGCAGLAERCDWILRFKITLDVIIMDCCLSRLNRASE